MSFYTVNPSCVRCGLCERICPAHIIEEDAGRLPFVREEKSAFCIRCGQCVAFCPQQCNSLAFQEDALPAVDRALFPSPESAETLLRTRRSVRLFKKDPVPRETLLRLFETLRYAPTAQNRQAVRWVVLETQEKVSALERQVVEFFRAISTTPPQGMSPARVSALRSVVKRFDSGNPIIFRNAPQLAIAVVPVEDGFTQEDGVIALTYLELAAHALGIGCCWGGFFTRAARASGELCRSLGLRDDELVAGAQMLGYPTHGVSKRLPPRKKPEIAWL